MSLSDSQWAELEDVWLAESQEGEDHPQLVTLAMLNKHLHRRKHEQGAIASTPSTSSTTRASNTACASSATNTSNATSTNEHDAHEQHNHEQRSKQGAASCVVTKVTAKARAPPFAKPFALKRGRSTDKLETPPASSTKKLEMRKETFSKLQSGHQD